MTKPLAEIGLQRAAFAAALGHCTKIIARRNTIPILSSVLLSSVGGRVVMRATDMDMWIEIPLGVTADTKKMADLAVTAAPVASWLPHMVDDIVIVDDGERITITSGDSKLKVNERFIPIDHPAPLAYKVGGSATFGWGDLIRSISRVMGAVSTEETRYYLNGLNMLNLGGGSYKIRCTDGHRLYSDLVQARQRKAADTADLMPLATGGGGDGIIIPTAIIKAATSTFKASGAVKMEVLASEAGAAVAISFSDGIVKLTGKLIDGTFPDADRVIPNISKGHISTRVGIADLKAAIARLPGMGSRMPAIKFQPLTEGTSEGQMVTYVPRLRLSNSDGQYFTETILRLPEACRIKGEFGVNAKYLLATLKFLADEKGTAGEIELFTSEGHNPIVIKRASAIDDDRMAILMPMRV